MATSYQDLPLTLDVHDLGRALHLSRSSAYRLLHEPGFPTLHVGHRLLVPRDHLIRWIDENTARQTVENTPGPNPKIVGSCE